MNLVVMAGIALSLAPGVMSPVSAQSMQQSAAVPASSEHHVTLTAQQKTVWQGEEDYWEYVNGRDLKSYFTLWHPNFRGWPCGAEHPADLVGLRRFAAEWFSEMTKAGQSTRPEVEAVVLDHGFAITYLSARTVWTGPDGVKQSKLEKFVHTWKATNRGWKIIGGMCAPLERKEALAK